MMVFLVEYNSIDEPKTKISQNLDIFGKNPHYQTIFQLAALSLLLKIPKLIPRKNLSNITSDHDQPRGREFSIDDGTVEDCIEKDQNLGIFERCQIYVLPKLSLLLANAH